MVSTSLVFQSSPALTGGCYLPLATKLICPFCGFNPHPPLRADAILFLHQDVPILGVSILTRPYGRMLSGHSIDDFPHIPFQSSPALTGGCYAVPLLILPSIQSFNPHPPLRADAIRTQTTFRWWQRVSILTRPYGRMLYSPGGGAKGEDCMFQSSPALTGGCYGDGPVKDNRLIEFQSSPALTGGCYASLSVRVENAVMFQSSPALTGGCYSVWLC